MPSSRDWPPCHVVRNWMPADPPLAGLTILVVDDHADTVEMFREYLAVVNEQLRGEDIREIEVSV